MASVLLSGCNTKANPANWFGGGKPAPASPAETNALIPPSGPRLFQNQAEEDPSVPITSITELRIEPDLSGAIVYASGLAERQGAFAAQLRPTSEDLVPEDGVLTFDFMVAYPEYRTAVGPKQTRKVVVGFDLSGKQLAGVRSIRVVAQNNALESRRR